MINTHKLYTYYDEILSAYEYGVQNHIPIIFVDARITQFENQDGRKKDVYEKGKALAGCDWCFPTFNNLFLDERFRKWLEQDCKYIWLCGGFGSHDAVSNRGDTYFKHKRFVEEKMKELLGGRWPDKDHPINEDYIINQGVSFVIFMPYWKKENGEEIKAWYCSQNATDTKKKYLEYNSLYDAMVDRYGEDQVAQILNKKSFEKPSWYESANSFCASKSESTEALGMKTTVSVKCKDGKWLWALWHPNNLIEALTEVWFKDFEPQIHEHTVQFLDYNLSVIKEQKVEDGLNATPPPNPSREGYEFTKWNRSYLSVTQDLSIYAKYEKIEEVPENNLAEQLVSMNLGTNVISVGDYSFKNCKNLYEVTGGKNLRCIGTEAFRNDTKLTTFEKFQENTSERPLEYAGNRAFEGTSLKKLNLSLRGSSIYTFWGDYCFANNQELEEVNFLSSSFMSNNMFYNCRNLKKVSFQNNYTSYVYPYVFRNCSSLESITLPNKIWYISESMFEGCSNLKSVEFSDYDNGSMINLVQRDAFYGCSSLTSIEFPSSINSLSCLVDGCFNNIPKLNKVVFHGVSKDELIKESKNSVKLEYELGVVYKDDDRLKDIQKCAEENNIPILYCRGSKDCSDCRKFSNNYCNGETKYTKEIKDLQIIIVYTTTGQFSKGSGHYVIKKLVLGKKQKQLTGPNVDKPYSEIDVTEVKETLKEWGYGQDYETGTMYHDRDDETAIIKYAKDLKIPICYCLGATHNSCEFCNNFAQHYWGTNPTQRDLQLREKLKKFEVIFIFAKGNTNHFGQYLATNDYFAGGCPLVAEVVEWDGHIKRITAAPNGGNTSQVQTTTLSATLEEWGYDGTHGKKEQTSTICSYTVLDSIYTNGFFRLNHDVTIVSKEDYSINYEYDSNRVQQYVDPIEYTSDKNTTANFSNGTWYYNAKQIKEYADATGRPLLCIYSLLGCKPCQIYADNIWDNSEFQTWVSKQNFLFCGIESDSQAYYDNQLNYCVKQFAPDAQNYIKLSASSEITNVFGEQFKETIDASGNKNSNLFTPVIIFYHKPIGYETPKTHMLYTYHNIDKWITKNGVQGVVRILERLCLYHFDENDPVNAIHCVDVDKAFELSDTNEYMNYENYDRYYNRNTKIVNMTSYGDLSVVSEQFLETFGYRDYVGGCSMISFKFFEEIGMYYNNPEQWNSILSDLSWKFSNEYYQLSAELEGKKEIDSKCNPGSKDTIYSIAWLPITTRVAVNMRDEYGTLQDFKDKLEESYPDTEGEYIGGCIIKELKFLRDIGLDEETFSGRPDYFNDVLDTHKFVFAGSTQLMQIDYTDYKVISNPCAISADMNVYKMVWTPNQQ